MSGFVEFLDGQYLWEWLGSQVVSLYVSCSGLLLIGAGSDPCRALMAIVAVETIGDLDPWCRCGRLG